MKRLLPLIVLLFALFTGCATIEQSPMTAQLVTNQITLRFIAGSDEPEFRASGVREVVAKIRGHVSGTESYSLAEIDAVVRKQINWHSLNAADQELLDFALTKARASLAELIGEGQIDPAETETVATLLTWIDNAALRVQ